MLNETQSKEVAEVRQKKKIPVLESTTKLNVFLQPMCAAFVKKKQKVTLLLDRYTTPVLDGISNPMSLIFSQQFLSFLLW